MCYLVNFSFLFISLFGTCLSPGKTQGKCCGDSSFIFFKSNQGLGRRPRVAAGGNSGTPAGSRGLSAGECRSRPRTARIQAPGYPSRYHLTLIALIYFLPLAVLFVAYSVIGHTLWRRTIPGYQAHGANTHYLQAKKKVGTGEPTGPGRAGRGPRPSPASGAAFPGSRPALKGAPQCTECTCNVQGLVLGQSLNSFFPSSPICLLVFGRIGSLKEPPRMLGKPGNPKSLQNFRYFQEP